MLTLRSARARGVVVWLLQLIVTVVAVGYAYVPSGGQPGIDAISIALLLMYGWSLFSWRLLGRPLFDPYILFLSSAYLFNAGHPLLDVFNLTPNGILGGVFSEAILKSTLLLVFIGVSALHLGAASALLIGSSSRRAAVRPSKPLSLRWIGWGCLLVGSPAALIWLSRGVAVVAESGYSSLYDRDYSTGLFATPLLLMSLLITGALFLTAGGRQNRLEARLAGAIIILFVTVQFYLGYRSTAAMPLIAWAWLRHRAVRPIRSGVLVGAAATLLLVVFPVVRETRNMPSLDRSLDIVSSSLLSLENPLLTSVDEMGQSMGTVAHTVALVPSSRPFDNGEGYAYAFLTLFPNLFWNVHPTIARGTNNDWLVAAIDPWLAMRGGAYGYSPIAEAYLNFGVLGTPFVMCFFGALLVWLVQWAETTGDPARLALVGTVLAFTLRFPRDELAGVLRPVVWYAVLPYLAALAGPAMARGALKTRAIRVVQPETLSAP